jgi:hypothetical protein
LAISLLWFCERALKLGEKQESRQASSPKGPREASLGMGEREEEEAEGQ